MAGNISILIAINNLLQRHRIFFNIRLKSIKKLIFYHYEFLIVNRINPAVYESVNQYLTYRDDFKIPEYTDKILNVLMSLE